LETGKGEKVPGGAWGRWNRFMERNAAEVLRDALALPPEARGTLIDSLIRSRDQGSGPTAEEAWREEICRRVQRVDSGAVAPIPWDDARRRLRTRVVR